MNNPSYVCLTAAGQPVSVSTGVKLINSSEGLLAGAGVCALTPDTGSVKLEFEGPVLGPQWRKWQTRQRVGHHPLDINQLNLAGRVVDFIHLTVSQPYWVRDDKGGTHVLMDRTSRRLVAVSPLEDHLRGAFWSAIADGLANLPEAPAAEALVTRWAAAELYRKGVWACLHPAPRRGPANLWCFDGPRYVRFAWTGERDDETQVIADEALCLACEPVYA